MKVGDKFKHKYKKLWGGGIEQEVISIIEITKCFNNRCEYKTINIISSKNVNPYVKNLLDIKGGFAYAMLDMKLDSYKLEKIA